MGHRKRSAPQKPERRPAPTPSAGGGARQWQRWLPLAAILVLTLVVYWPARQAAYISDDSEYLLDNTAVQHWNTFGELWVPGNTALYVPMVTSSLWLEHKLWGLGTVGADGILRATGYHTDSILLHGCSAMLLFVILRRLKLPGGPGAAWLAAAVFAVHPVTVESVAWLAERKNNLCGVFFFASLFFSGRAFGIFEGASGQRRHYALALAFFLLAMLAKVAACFLPGAIVALLWWKQGRVSRRQVLALLPMALMVVVLGGLIAYFEHHRGGTQGKLWDFSFTQRVLIAGNAFWFQLGKLFWPSPIISIYPRFPIDAGKPVGHLWLFWGPAAYVALVALCVAVRKWAGRGPLAVVAIYTMGLFPTLGFVSFYTMIFSFVADHYQYLACPVVFVFAIEAGAGGLRKLKDMVAEKARPEEHARMWRFLRAGLGAGLIVPLGALSFGISHLYARPVMLWDHAWAHNPDNPEILGNLALALINEDPKNLPVSTALIEKAIRLNPDDFRPYVWLGWTYEAVGMFVESAAARYEAEKRMPAWERSFNDYFLRDGAKGSVSRSGDYVKAQEYENQGRWDAAIALYQADLARRPDDDDAALRMGFCQLAGRNDAGKAAEIYRQVLARHAENADAWLGLGFALRALGREEESRGALEKARQLGGDAVLLRHPEFLQPVK